MEQEFGIEDCVDVGLMVEADDEVVDDVVLVVLMVMVMVCCLPKPSVEDVSEGLSDGGVDVGQMKDVKDGVELNMRVK